MMIQTYARLLAAQDEADFVEACDRILWTDEWFPTIARLGGMIEQCRVDREAYSRAKALASSPGPGGLVCGICKGARWLRTGVIGKIVACSGCTYEGAYNPLTEKETIRRLGGVVPEGAQPTQTVDVHAALEGMRRPDGGVDMEALYRHSRELRGLDPAIDGRPQAVAGFRTFGQSAAELGVPV